MTSDLPDWTKNVNVAAGSVTIAGTASVSIVGTPSVTIASGTVNIGNTPSVTVSSGTVNIGNTPSVTVASGSVTVSSGTVNIGNTPSVTIASGSVTVGSVVGNVSIINATGTQIAVFTDIDLFGAATPTLVAGVVKTPLANLAAPNNYSTVVVRLVPGADPAAAYQVGVQVANASKSLSSAWQTAHIETTVFTVDAYPAQDLYFQVPFDKGDLLNVNVVATTAVSDLNIAALGLANPAAPYGLRGDGRVAVVGRLMASGQFTGSASLVTAPTSPFRLMVKHVSLGGGIIGSGGAIAHALVVVGGATHDIASASCSAAGGGQGCDAYFGDGLLCDVAQGISLGALVGAPTQPFVASVVYDIVV